MKKLLLLLAVPAIFAAGYLCGHSDATASAALARGAAILENTIHPQTIEFTDDPRPTWKPSRPDIFDSALQDIAQRQASAAQDIADQLREQNFLNSMNSIRQQANLNYQRYLDASRPDR